ncbi:MAG TPA: glutamine--fructose-6-phosphate transaminase (isomerizing) [Anaerolineae bacterium]|nr:glutamine--fructose-6-phosphate transaminase (isomerizing) [Anaerolineae bacterium]
MCGIVGYIGQKDATPIVLNGLKRLEYRGYDSAGLAILQDETIKIRRVAGKIDKLFELVSESPLKGNIGIGHTRWATHGEPNKTNAHPHLGSNKDVVIVHNGIVENYLELKDELIEEGVNFKSETDTEVIVHLIELFLTSGLRIDEAVRMAIMKIRGAHGIVVFSKNEPDRIIAARIGNAGGVVIGVGKNEMFIASDIPAILDHTRKMIFLESQQMAIVKSNEVDIYDLNGNALTYEVHNVNWDPVSAEKGDHKHFMHKEIHEQVRSLIDTIAGRVNFTDYLIKFNDLSLDKELAISINKIFITACGTAAYAGMVGKILIEKVARIPVEVVIGSEFRYSDPIIDENTIVLAISQSGETADTLAAMDEGKKRGAKIWVIVNAIGSQAMRIADGYISMQAGPEIGVASTKAYTAPLVDLYMLAILLGELRDSISEQQRRDLVNNLRLVPDLVGECLTREDEIVEIAKRLENMQHCLYLGRGINMPTAYEGALKLKEISYIHAEGYPAGEMKHGPIALIDNNMPVIVISPKDPWYEKMISQIEQAKARGGFVIALATDGDELIKDIADRVIWVPETPWMLSPVISIIPLQLLAYHIAHQRGLDVDQPRNLAKSVTVE